MMNRMSRCCARIAVLALFSVSTAFAAEPAKPADPSPEAREQMAAVQQKLAECLRSDRPIAECKAAMMKSCHEGMGEHGCPMMGPTGGGMGPGMTGGGMMKGEPAPEAPKK